MVVVYIEVEIYSLFVLVAVLIVVVTYSRVFENGRLIVDVENHRECIVLVDGLAHVVRAEIEGEFKFVLAVVYKTEFGGAEFQFHVCGDGASAVGVGFVYPVIVVFLDNFARNGVGKSVLHNFCVS